ncbi:MAG: hypothetical protein H7177_08915 [Rhizobacter sp.]|nr:hypothetical protein [Bacteriovorax sp.]
MLLKIQGQAMIRKIFILILALLGAASLFYSHNIQQKNPETIFLTTKTLEEYKIFQKDILEKHSLVIKRETQDKDEFYRELKSIESLCTNDCEIITQRSLKKTKRARKASKNELMNLETGDFSSALILDNNDDNPKKILSFVETSPYWSSEKTSFAGLPYTNFLLDKYSLTIQEKLFPTMFILGLIISILFIGNLKNALVVYLPCLFSAGFSLTTLKLFDGQMNMVTSIVPLVVFTVTLSLSFHMYFSLTELKNLKAVFKVKWAPIFLMMFTTYIGFLSLGWAEISVIREFGIMASQLVLFSTLYTFLWYYLWEIYITAPQKRVIKSFFPRGIFDYSIKYRAIILLSLLGIGSVLFVPKHLDIITDATLYFPKNKKIREKILSVTKTVSGMPVMDLAIDLGHEFESGDIQKMKELENGFKSLHLSQPYNIVSNNALVTKANLEYSGNESLPTSLDVYYLLRGQLPSSLQESYPLEKKYRMTVLGNPINVKEYMQDYRKVGDYLNSKKIQYQVSGIHHNLMMSQNSMIDVLTSSFISSAVVIFIFSAFFLKSVKLNAIFIFVTLMPVALTFGVMYLLGFSINIATVMTFSISLGLVGDSSFHIIYAKKVRFKDFDEYKRAVLNPVVGSGLLLCTCFGIFTFNTFMPIRQFGGILAVIMLFGTLVDLYILPTLLYNTSEHRKAYEAETIK